MPRPSASDFISNSRTLAAQFIAASNTFNALASELRLRGLDQSPDQGGLTDTDFVGTNADVTAPQVLTFYQQLGTLLAGLTDDEKKAIYAIK